MCECVWVDFFSPHVPHTPVAYPRVLSSVRQYARPAGASGKGVFGHRPQPRWASFEGSNIKKIESRASLLLLGTGTTASYLATRTRSTQVARRVAALSCLVLSVAAQLSSRDSAAFAFALASYNPGARGGDDETLLSLFPLPSRTSNLLPPTTRHRMRPDA